MPMARKILIVEDDRDVVELLKYNLEKEGFRVGYATDGNTALTHVRRFVPDLLILDLMLPGLDGLEICRQMRQIDQFASLPILMLTARAEEADRVVGLEIGADDYVTKPFSVRELIARVRSLLRRREAAGAQRSVVQQGLLTIDPQTHRVTVGNKPVELSALEFRLLYFLASNAGMVFSRGQLLDRVWGSDRSVTPRSVDVYVRRIREKIESQSAPAYLETVHGVGYRFAESTD
jgi:two-component system alkaline phosphatase synthesis response regulator PhoP